MNLLPSLLIDGCLSLLNSYYFIEGNQDSSYINRQCQLMNGNPLYAVIRRTQHYDCLKRVDFSAKSPKMYYQYEFKGLADPFSPLIIVFIKLTLPTKTIVTQELINFMLTSVQVYRSYNLEQCLIQQFFGPNLSSSSSQTHQIVLGILQEMLKNDQKANRRTFCANSTYPPIINFLRDDFKAITQDKEVFGMFKSRLNSNLAKYSIIPRSVKLARIKQLAQALQASFQTKIIIQQNTLILRTKGAEHPVDQIITLQMLIQSAHAIYEVDERAVQDGCRRLLEEVVSFQRCTQVFYKERKAEKHRISHWKGNPNSYQQKVNQKNLQYYPRCENNTNQSFWYVSPQNVIFFIEKISPNPSYNHNFRNNILKLNSQSNKQHKIYRIAPEFCSIDISICFLQELGIRLQPTGGQLIAGPICFQDFKLYHFPLHPLRSYNFASKMIQRQAGSILAWLLVVSSISTTLLQKHKQSIYEKRFSCDQVIELVVNKHHLLGSHVKTLLLLYEVEIQEPLSIETLQFQSWINLLKPKSSQLEVYLQTHKYDKAKLLLETMKDIFFGCQNFKYFVQKTSFFVNSHNLSRYIIIFMVSKLIQIIFERQILTIYQEEPDDLWKEELGLRNMMEKHEAIHRLAAQKIRTYYVKSQRDETIKRLLDSPIFVKSRLHKKGLYQELVNHPFGTLARMKRKEDIQQKQIMTKDQTQESEQLTENWLNRLKYIDNMRHQIKQCIDSIIDSSQNKNQIINQGQFYSQQLFIIKKNLLQLQALYVLTPNNYCEIKMILAEVQMLRETFLEQRYQFPTELEAFFTTKQSILQILKNPRKLQTQFA